MMFRRRPQVVAAEQFTKGKQPWPNGVCICTNHGHWGLHVHTNDEIKHVGDQMWVVRDLEGKLDCLTHEDFEALYEPMP